MNLLGHHTQNLEKQGFGVELKSPDIVEKFAQLGMSSSHNSAADFGTFLRAEVPKWAAVVKSSGAKAD